MAKKRWQRPRAKYEDDAIIVQSKVLSIVERVEYAESERVKTSFYCESSSGTPRLCVMWQKTILYPGDVVHMKGRLSRDTFLVWSLMYENRKENEQSGG